MDKRRVFSKAPIKTRQILKYERKFKKSLGDLIDIDGLSFTDVINLIELVADVSEEVACEIWDEYKKDHTFLDTLLQLFYELDLDTGILKMSNTSIEDMEAKLSSNKNEDSNIIDDKVVLKPGETPKINNDGSVTLD